MRLYMQVDWDKTINDILAGKLTCQACNVMDDEMIVGYTREAEAAEFAPRCRECVDKSDCDVRKLVCVCEDCARKYRVNGERMGEPGMMAMLMEECRSSLEESLDYLSTYWKEEANIEYDEMQGRFEELDPETFAQEDEWRSRLEQEYMQLHHWFREHKLRVPDPAWRAQYTEDIIALGYTTLLGD